ncbi:MAG: hypothetical protein OQJ81_13560 [Melioribacteraceae bacterium]|nr:hypothetical protein [Melioribacteraceae bacterium]
MKKKIIYTAVVLLTFVTLNLDAQTLDSKRKEAAFENCYHSLMSDNQGVLESAIFVSLQFKSKFPEMNADKMVKALAELATNSDNARISYKAQLAILYFKNKAWFDKIEVKSIHDEQKIFEEIAETLSNSLLASNN